MPYYPLNDKNLSAITELKVKSLAKRLAQSYHSKMECDDNFYDWVISQCNQGDTGARQIDLVMNNRVLPLLSEKILERISGSNTFVCVQLSVSGDQKLEVKFVDNEPETSCESKAQTA